MHFFLLSDVRLDYHRNEAVKARASCCTTELRPGLRVLDDRSETTGKKLSDSETVV
jgi:hypothetical protein